MNSPGSFPRVSALGTKLPAHCMAHCSHLSSPAPSNPGLSCCNSPAHPLRSMPEAPACSRRPVRPAATQLPPCLSFLICTPGCQPGVGWTEGRGLHWHWSSNQQPPVPASPFVGLPFPGLLGHPCWLLWNWKPEGSPLTGENPHCPPKVPAGGFAPVPRRGLSQAKEGDSPALTQRAQEEPRPISHTT